MIKKITKEINGLKYTASIFKNEIMGITFQSPKFIGKRMLPKYVNSYSSTMTTRFSNIAKHFEMPDYCFTDVPENNRYRVAKIIENKAGYYPLNKMNKNDQHELDKFVFENKEEVRIVVNNMNSHLGINKDREEEIKLSTFEFMDS